MKNPLLEQSIQPYGTIPFNELKIDHFIPAIKSGIRESESSIEKITQNADSPTFENTVLSLELSGGSLNTSLTAYYHLFGSESDKDFKNLSDEISPMVAEFENNVYLNKNLFRRIEAVYKNRKSLNLNEDQRLLDVTYKDFIRNGAALNDKDKDKLRKIDKELSTLSPQFSKNALNATNEFELWLEKDDLDGLPKIVIDSAKLAAKEKGDESKWLITGQFPSFSPFLKYSNKRELRKKVHFAITTKCNGGKHDNNDLCKKIAKLKHQRAKILGFSNYADYILEERMAEKQERIYDLLDNLYDSSIEHAKKDLKKITDIAKKIDNIDKIKSWDIAFYSEKLKQKIYDFNENELKPYFQSNEVMKGAFKVAEKLYGLNFKELTDIEIWHDEVRTFEVSGEDNEHIGLLYVDLFPRKTKRSGAWMNPMLENGLYKGKVRRPHVVFVCNLTPSSENQPSLLSYGEVETVFHEFGHCLHGLLSNSKYSTIGNTNVKWDFVELPSQIMENWASEKEALNLFAHHFETGDNIPDELMQKIKDSKNFGSANMCLRQLSLGYIDMAWHTQTDPIEDIEQFEKNTLEKTALFEKTKNTTISSHFGHIFGGGDAAGYYSYKWAEVLEADAFESFKENGIFDKKTALSFRKNILSKGNLENPMNLYKDFKGREPQVDALLKRDGLI